MYKQKIFKIISFFLFFLVGTCFCSADLSVSTQSITFSPIDPILGQNLRIFVKVNNSSSEPLKGVVKVFDETEGVFVGGDQSITALGNSSGDVFVDFMPSVEGEHTLAVKIIPWEEVGDNTINNKIIINYYVDLDTDADGVPNRKDNDDDGDGVNDGEDKFPLNPAEWQDSDNDGEGDNKDEDDDNDTVPDLIDAFPNNPNETEDSDNDGIGNNEDQDDDNDGVSDEGEKLKGTDPLKADTDEDGIIDSEDDFPLDNKKGFDTDGDGIDNNEDDDDDNDGIKDKKDVFPLDATEWEDKDKDGIGDNADKDDDNDKLEDEKELAIGTNPLKQDTDKDGVIDGEDAFPLDKNESQDSDNDGLGDNADPNDKNKGPEIMLLISDTSVQKNDIISFNAGGSRDPEGGELEFLWQFPGDEVKTEAIFEQKLRKIGKNKIILKVTDIKDESRERIIEIMVYPTDLEIYFIIIALIVALIGVYFLIRKKAFKIKNIYKTK